MKHLRFSSIIRFFRDIRKTAGSEFGAILLDSGVCIFVFLVPLVYPILYSFIYNPEVVHEAPLVVINQDNTPLSRVFIRRIDASPEVRVVAILPTEADAKEMVDRKEAYGCLIIPHGFSDQLLNGRQTKVSLISDMASLFYYKAYMIVTNDVALEMGQELSTDRHFTGSRELTKIIVRPIQNVIKPLYNPVGGYASFLLPCVLILILQQTMLLAVCTLAGTARERGSHTYKVIRLSSRRLLPTRIVLGRSLAYLFLYLLISLWTLVIIPYIFRLPMLAKWYELLAFLLPFLLAITFFSQTIAFFIRGREETMIYLVFTSVLFIFISGVSWPLSALPGFWRGVGYLVPSVPATQCYIGLNSYGAPLTDMLPQYLTLWIQSLVYMIFAAIGGRLLIRLYGGE